MKPIRIFLFLICSVFPFGFSLSAQKLVSDVDMTLVQEEYAPGKFSYSIHCETKETFNNGSTVITYSKKKSGATYKIIFTGTKTPSKVKKSIEPARAIIDLGKLKDGTYEFTFQSMTTIGNIYYSATLIVSGSNFQWTIHPETT